MWGIDLNTKWSKAAARGKPGVLTSEVPSVFSGGNVLKIAFDYRLLEKPT
jgi:hypothetical protein